MELPLKTKYWTKDLTNDSITITEAMNVKGISVLNISAVSGTINGGTNIPSLGDSQDSTIAQYQSRSIPASSDASVITGVVITAPAGCTLQVTLGL